MSEEQKKLDSFSKREWLMLLAGLLMLEAWCLNASYAFHGDEMIINYVSFAATIASLLLAVIAIIYGYFQADGQQRSAAAVAYQIETMRAVQKELNDSSRGISKQLGGLTTTAEELNKLSVALEGTHKALGAIEGGIGSIAEQQLAVQAAIAGIQVKAKETPISTPRIADDLTSRVSAIFSAATFQADLLGVALYGLSLHRGGEAARWPDFIDKHFVTPILKTDDLHEKVQLASVGAQLLRVAGALGIVEFHVADSDNRYKITLNKDALASIEKQAKIAMSSETTQVRAADILASFAVP